MQITEKDNGGTFQITRGSRVEIKLPGNPTTGHRWKAPVIHTNGAWTDTVLVVLDRYTPSTPILVGSGGVRDFIMEFTAAGVFNLRFPYGRAWEPKPAKFFSATFKVK